MYGRTGWLLIKPILTNPLNTIVVATKSPRKGPQPWTQLLLPHTPRRSSSLAESSVTLLGKTGSDIFLGSHAGCPEVYFVLLVFSANLVPQSCGIVNGNEQLGPKLPLWISWLLHVQKPERVFYLFIYLFSFFQSINPWAEASHIRMSVGTITNKYAGRKPEEAQRTKLFKRWLARQSNPNGLIGSPVPIAAS